MASKIKYLVSFLFLCSVVSAQHTDIEKYLSMIDNGNLVEANKNSNRLLSSNPNDLNVLYLDALLTKNGNSAINKYLSILDKQKKFEYSDAVLYNVFSYYYSLGIYKKAGTYLNTLRNEYPNSKFIKMTDRKVPDEDILDISEQKPKVATKPKKEKTETVSYRFTIQAGAFSNEKNAKKLNQSFLSEGEHSEINIKDIGGILLNVVTVGKFKNKEEASRYLSHLKSKYKLNGRIIELN